MISFSQCELGIRSSGELTLYVTGTAAAMAARETNTRGNANARRIFGLERVVVDRSVRGDG